MFGVFDPGGPIALAERNIIVTAVLLMLAVAIPLLAAFYIFVWKYRDGNGMPSDEPDRPHGPWAELVWWLIPSVIIGVIAVMNWTTTHALDPSRPIDSPAAPLMVEVVALQWKWLFIYPAQGIATVNFLEFPVGTPVRFELTADAPMSSFWIPELGSQIYAMAGMQTELNLEADRLGEFTGKNTEINGRGYAGMTFVARAVSPTDFSAWVAYVRTSSSKLGRAEYESLAAPSEKVPPFYYGSVDANLYDTILSKPARAQGNSSAAPVTAGK